MHRDQREDPATQPRVSEISHVTTGGQYDAAMFTPNSLLPLYVGGKKHVQNDLLPASSQCLRAQIGAEIAFFKCCKNQSVKETCHGSKRNHRYLRQRL